MDGYRYYDIPCSHAPDGISHQVMWNIDRQHIKWNCPFTGPTQVRETAMLMGLRDCHSEFRHILKQANVGSPADPRFTDPDVHKRMNKLAALLKRRALQQPCDDELVTIFIGSLFKMFGPWMREAGGVSPRDPGKDFGGFYFQQARYYFTLSIKRYSFRNETIHFQQVHSNSGTIRGWGITTKGDGNMAALLDAITFYRRARLDALFACSDAVRSEDALLRQFILNARNWRQYTRADHPPWEAPLADAKV